MAAYHLGDLHSGVISDRSSSLAANTLPPSFLPTHYCQNLAIIIYFDQGGVKIKEMQCGLIAVEYSALCCSPTE